MGAPPPKCEHGASTGEHCHYPGCHRYRAPIVGSAELDGQQVPVFRLSERGRADGPARATVDRGDVPIPPPPDDLDLSDM